MKNFTTLFSQKGIGGFLTFALLIFFTSPPARAQVLPYANNNTAYSQMWNVTSKYFNTPTSANLGTQLDTVTNAATLNLTLSSWDSSRYLKDTFNVYALAGTGGITLTLVGLKCTGTTDSAYVTPQMSPDGVHWSIVPGATTTGLLLTSTTVPVTLSVFYRDKQVKYYRWQIVGIASSSSSWQAYYYFWSNFTIYKSQ